MRTLQKSREKLLGPNPPPDQLNDWHLTFLFFIVDKPAYHGADSAALLPRCMQNIIHKAFSALGRAKRWFGTGWVEMKWSPLNQFHLDSFLHSIPPNYPSFLSPPPQTVHISWLFPWMGGTVLTSILHVASCLLSSYNCRPIVVIQLLSSNCRPQVTAIVVIDIAAINVGSGGIITINRHHVLLW